VPPEPRVNSWSVIGDAESRVVPVTVSMTKSPGVNDVIALANTAVVELANVTETRSAL
jgi:hypothetical protein